jgi:hypothetical protein
MMDAKKVDVLGVFDELISFEERHAEYEPRANHEAREARDAMAELIAEMRRYLPVIEHLESRPELWGEFCYPIGIATANGYRHALSRIGAPA